MLRHFGLRLAALFAGALLLGGCFETSDEPTTAEVRYRVTVTVDTPDGERSGSSVWSWKLIKPTLALATPFSGKFKGEAVAVELPNGKTLFGLLDGIANSPAMLPERQFYDSTRGMRDRIENINLISKRIGEVRELPCEVRGPDDRVPEFRFDCLRLAAFEDMDDPSSILVVDYRDAAATLGEGYEIESISITITDESVTTGIRSRLPWYKIDDLSKFDWDKVPRSIFVGDFRRNFDRGL